MLRWIWLCLFWLPFGMQAQLDAKHAEYMLKKYASDELTLLQRYIDLPVEVSVRVGEGGTRSSRKTTDPYHYLSGDREDDWLGSISTNIHELSHALTHLNAFEYSRKKAIPFGAGLNYYFYLSPDEEYFIQAPDQFFPSSLLASEIPTARRTFRFNTYITGTSSTQAHGLLGLLNEFNAYYHSLKTDWLLRDAYLNMKGNPLAYNYVAWFNQLGSYRAAYDEFRFFIFEYLRYAYLYKPDVFTIIRNDPRFATIFNAVSARYRILSELVFQENSVGIQRFCDEHHLTYLIRTNATYIQYEPGAFHGALLLLEDYNKLKDVLASDRYEVIKRILKIE